MAYGPAVSGVFSVFAYNGFLQRLHGSDKFGSVGECQRDVCYRKVLNASLGMTHIC